MPKANKIKVNVSFNLELTLEPGEKVTHKTIREHVKEGVTGQLTDEQMTFKVTSLSVNNVEK